LAFRPTEAADVLAECLATLVAVEGIADMAFSNSCVGAVAITAGIPAGRRLQARLFVGHTQ